MRTINLLSLLLIFCSTFTSMQLEAAMTANEYKNIIGRGMATDEAKNMDNQTMIDFKNRGFDNIRLRVDASKAYTNAHIAESVVAIVDRALAAGIVPIIAWNNNDAEARANEQDRQDYIAWWTKVSSQMANHSDLVSFNLMLEISNGSPLRDDMNVYESWAQPVIDIIRADNPTRVIILSSPGKKANGLAEIPSSLYENDNYMMAEWHLYASGPDHDNGGQKEWRGDGNTVGKDNVDACIQPATVFTNNTGIPTWFGALMPYSQHGYVSDSEAKYFTTYMLEQLSEARIPFCINAIGNCYDDNAHEWRGDVRKGNTTYDMHGIIDLVTTVGDFLWDDTPGSAPAAPSSVNASATSCSSVNLSWSDNSNNEDNFIVKQSVNGGSYSVIATLGANVTGYTVSGLNENTSYTYKVSAENNYGNSAYTVSNTVTTQSCQGTTEVTLGATDDSYILDNNTGANRGAATEIMVKNVTKKAGLIKFDISSVSGQISSATLQLKGVNAANGGNLSVYSVSNDNWSESTVTYNNAPAQGSLLGAIGLGAAGTVYSIDVSNFVVGESNGDGVVSLWINDNQENGSRYDFASKEASGDNGPKLVLQVGGGEPPVTYTLTTNAANGSVSPAGGTFNEGTVVTLTATPDAGYTFSNWSGSVSGTANPKNITMNGNKSVTANFVEVQVPVYTLTTNVVGSGSVSPSGGSYEEGTVVTLTATAGAGYVFDGWSGDASGSNATTSVTMNSNKSVTATFVEEPIGPITSTVTASGDAYVRNGSYSSTNYGSSAELQVKTTTNANAKRFSYLQFDLSSIGAVTSAQLEVKSIGNENADIKVYSTSDSWDEGSILWSNKPAFGNLEATLAIGANGTYTVDVTSYVAAQANGDNTASFALKCATSRLMTLSSKEGSYAPRLVIEHDGSPSAAINAVTSNVEMYPNPTTGLVNISVNDADFTTAIVKVVNSYGAVIKDIIVEEGLITIDLNNYNAGIYYITVSYNNTSVTKSLLVH